MESTDKHEINPILGIFIILIIAFVILQLLIFGMAIFFSQEIDCFWWGCRMHSIESNETPTYNITSLQDFAEAINQTMNMSNTTQCYFNNTMYNISCKEVINKTLGRYLNKMRLDDLFLNIISGLFFIVCLPFILAFVVVCIVTDNFSHKCKYYKRCPLYSEISTTCNKEAGEYQIGMFESKYAGCYQDMAQGVNPKRL